MNGHRETKKHELQSTHAYSTNVHAYSHIFTRAFKHTHTQRSHPTQMHTYISKLHTDTYPRSIYMHTLGGIGTMRT